MRLLTISFSLICALGLVTTSFLRADQDSEDCRVLQKRRAAKALVCFKAHSEDSQTSTFAKLFGDNQENSRLQNVHPAQDGYNILVDRLALLRKKLNGERNSEAKLRQQLDHVEAELTVLISRLHRAWGHQHDFADLVGQESAPACEEIGPEPLKVLTTSLQQSLHESRKLAIRTKRTEIRELTEDLMSDAENVSECVLGNTVGTRVSALFGE